MSGKFSSTFIASLALLAALVAGCSSHSNVHHSKSTHSAPAGGGNGIPQGNGGDHDGYNNGGPSDGDGKV